MLSVLGQSPWGLLVPPLTWELTSCCAARVVVMLVLTHAQGPPGQSPWHCCQQPGLPNVCPAYRLYQPAGSAADPQTGCGPAPVPAAALVVLLLLLALELVPRLLLLLLVLLAASCAVPASCAAAPPAWPCAPVQ